jgi:hypothetical protein
MTDLAKALYFEVYLLAGKSDAGGLVLAGDEPASADDVAFILRRSIDAVQTGLTELQASGFVELDAGTMTVCRFAGEQGPSQKVTREQWARRTAKRRALARGEAWDEPDADQEPDQNLKPDAELKTDTDLKIKSKSVTTPSQNSHRRVTRDTNSAGNNGGGGGFEQQILDAWTELTGQEFKSNQKFVSMVADWQSEGVTLQEVRQAILEHKDKANTPLYLYVIVQNLHRRNKNKTAGTGADLEKYRALARKQNQINNGGDE